MKDKDWYYKIIDDHSKIISFFDYFFTQYEEGKKMLKMEGYIIANSNKMPGIFDLYFNQLQIIEAVLKYFEIQLDKIHATLYNKYLTNYNKLLTSRDVEKYILGEQEYIDMKLLINEIALLRNTYLGLLKGLDSKSFQLNNITKLRTAGLDDAKVD